MTRESSRTPHSQVRHSDLGRLQSKAAAIEIPDVNVIIGIRSVGGFPPRVAEESDAIQRGAIRVCRSAGLRAAGLAPVFLRRHGAGPSSSITAASEWSQS